MAQPLHRQILILNACVLVPLFLAIAWAGWRTYQEQLEQLQQETRTMSSTVRAYLDRSVESLDSVAKALALHPAVRTLDRGMLAEVLPEFADEPLLENLFVSDIHGAVMAWAAPPERSVQEWLGPSRLQRVAAEQERMVSRLIGEAGGPRHSLVFAHPVVDSQRGAIAVVGLQVRLEAFESVLASIPLPEGSVVTLTDEQSMVLARSRDAAQFVGRPTEAPGHANRLSDVPETLIRSGVDGVERVFGNSRVNRGPWLVSVGIPTSVARARARATYERNFGLATAAAVVILLLEAVMVRRYVSALRQVERIAGRVADGDLTAPACLPMPAREFDHLQSSFSEMVQKLREAQSAVAAQVADERRIREEVQSLQRQVIRQERLAAIGVLVSGVAHELNNPLQAIMGFAELLQLRGDVSATVQADLKLIQKESARASAIIKNLSRFGRQQTSEPTPVRLQDVVASVVELRQRKLHEQGIRVHLHEASQATVLAVFTELQQVLLNFVINAEQAVLASARRPQRIVIRTVNREDRALVEVEDTGPGVPPEDEPRLFQPFFTTKPVGEGTGLGLSVSYGIIASHGGTIGYRVADSGGAIFFFELPVLRAEQATA